MIKITKFGGSSVANAEQFRKVKAIIEADDSRRFVVISAAGKTDKEANKITDLLYLCHAHVEYHVDYRGIFDLIKQRFLDIKKELGLNTNIEKELDALSRDLPKLTVDELVSRGEYFTSRMMADLLRFPFVDARDVIKLNYDGSIDFETTDENLRFVMKDHERFVMPGFYGTTPDGNIKVMSRGGSDITGSILAKCLHADLYENWTDVSGFLMADPRIVRDPRGIEKITFAELRELSYMGASVLHEDAVFPVKEANIPINILNTNRPEDKGTIILDSIPQDSSGDEVITGIAGKKGFCALSFYKKHMPESVGFCRKILSVFEKYGVSVEHLPSGIDSISMVIQERFIKDRQYDLIAEIKEKAEPDDIKFIPDLALIATVGRNMSSRIGTSAKLFSSLADNGVNVKMMIQAFDEINILVGVDSDDMENAIRAIYGAFVENG